MSEQRVNYVDEVRERTLNVLRELCEGDMVCTYGAFGAIYPGMWEKELTPEEMREYGDLIKQEIAKY